MQNHELDLRDSVMRQIRMILSARRSRQGSYSELTILDFGIPSVVDQMGADSNGMQKFHEEMRRVILAFEPRIRAVSVLGSNAETVLSKIRLKIELKDMVFEEEFHFDSSTEDTGNP